MADTVTSVWASFLEKSFYGEMIHTHSFYRVWQFTMQLCFLQAKIQVLKIIKCNVPPPPKTSDYPFIHYLFSFPNHLPYKSTCAAKTTKRQSSTVCHWYTQTRHLGWYLTGSMNWIYMQFYSALCREGILWSKESYAITQVTCVTPNLVMTVTFYEL